MHDNKGRAPDVSEQRASIAWCGRCGNVSVDGINFARIEGGLQCAGCGAVSPHFEYIRKSFSDPASVLAALLAEHPDATVAALETLLTSDEAVDHTLDEMMRVFVAHGPNFARLNPTDMRLVALRLSRAPSRSLRPKAPKEDDQ